MMSLFTTDFTNMFRLEFAPNGGLKAWRHIRLVAIAAAGVKSKQQ